MAFHKHSGIEEAVRPILTSIKHEATSLPFWEADSRVALYNLLVAFEDDVHGRAMIAWQTGDDWRAGGSSGEASDRVAGLSALIHEMYRRHTRLPALPDRTRFDRHALPLAQGALAYGARFGLAVEALYDACYRTRHLIMPNDEVFLPLTKEGTIEYEIRSTLRARERAARPISPYPFLEAGARLQDIARRAFAQTGPLSACVVVPAPLQDFLASFADRAVLHSPLPLHLAAGGYSVAEFRRVYRALSYRAALQHLVGWSTMASGKAEWGAGRLPLRLRREELWNEVAGTITESSFTRIVSDLMYDTRLPCPDIRYQPLLPLGNRECLVSPAILLASRWEGVLLRIWGHKYHDAYSRLVAAMKRQTAERLARALAVHGYRVMSNRPLHPYSGRTMGVADVLAFDAATNTLLLLQLTRLNVPSDAYEARQAQATLAAAVDRLRKVETFIREYPDRAATQLFAPSEIPIGLRTDVRDLIVDSGYTGPLGFLSAGAVVLDEQQFTDYAAGLSRGQDLRAAAIGLHRFLRPSPPASRGDEERFVLGGWSFRIPR